MKKLLFLLFAAMFISLLTVSCRSKEKPVFRNEEFEKTKNYSTVKLVNYLYAGCERNKDYKGLSRILGVTPEFLDKVRTGEVEPSSEFKIDVRLVTNKYIQCGCSIYELRKLCNDLKWYEKQFFWPKHKFKTWEIVLFIMFDLLIAFLFFGNGKQN